MRLEKGEDLCGCAEGLLHTPLQQASDGRKKLCQVARKPPETARFHASSECPIELTCDENENESGTHHRALTPATNLDGLAP